MQHQQHAQGFAPGPAYDPQRQQEHTMSMGGNGMGMGMAPPSMKEAEEVLGATISPLARTAMAAYGEKAQHFMKSKMNFFSEGPLMKSLQYYYDVNTKYVLNKLKLLLCPFIHKGSWTRIPEQVPGGFHFKPPRHDLNAPDLYLPSMALQTYCVLHSLEHVVAESFSPEVYGAVLWWGLAGWLLQVLALRFAVYALNQSGSGEGRTGVPLLDLCAYGGYAFIHASAQCAVSLMAGRWGYYVALAWGTLCMGVFLVKTLKRTFFSQARHSKYDMRKQNYLLLAIALAQGPLGYWLSRPVSMDK